MVRFDPKQIKQYYSILFLKGKDLHFYLLYNYFILPCYFNIYNSCKFKIFLEHFINQTINYYATEFKNIKLISYKNTKYKKTNTQILYNLLQ